MKVRWTVAAVLLCSISAGIASAISSDTIVVQTSYCLGKGEVAKFSREAMAGSPEAANKLTNMYWMCGLPDRVKTKYWALIGAENGNAESQFRARQTLKVSKDPLERQRALFWLRKAAEQDYL